MPTYKNGSNGAGKFVSGEATFVNYYESTYGSWSGFAVSKASDITTSGYGNQYSSVAGGGLDDENFMIAYLNSYSGATYIKFSSAQTLNSMSVTNSTYAHHSMRDGDAYAKKFGGDSGDDPDYFLLSAKGYNDGVYTDSIGFYLADFQDANNDNDYILDTWETMSLSSLGTIDSLVFELTSSDNGAYGMNTPAYFCMDDITLSSVGIQNKMESKANIYPNPAQDFIIVEADDKSEIKIMDISGKILYRETLNNSKQRINVSHLNTGVYIVSVTNKNLVYTQKLIKK